jgi:hypothetical protein
MVLSGIYLPRCQPQAAIILDGLTNITGSSTATLRAAWCRQ